MLLAAQVLTALSAACVPVLATEIASTIGVDAVLVGPYVGAYFGTAALASLPAGHLVRRLGAWGVAQSCIGAAALGLILLAWANVFSVALSAVVLGVATGPLTPASSQILIAITSERSRNTAFSIRQAGTPLGYAVAGLLLPTLALNVGWQIAVAALVPICITTAIAALIVAPWARDQPSPNPAGDTGLLPATIRVLHEIFCSQHLRLYAFIVISFSFMQTALTTFSVTMLVNKLNIDIVRAGEFFTLFMTAGGVARILWGWLADKLNADRIVILLGTLMAAAAFTFAVSTTQPVVAFAGGILGATAMGWHGVVLAQIARIVGVENTSRITGGIMFLALGSSLLAPNIFGFIAAALDDYAAGFGFFAALTLLSCIIFGRPFRRADART